MAKTSKLRRIAYSKKRRAAYLLWWAEQKSRRPLRNVRGHVEPAERGYVARRWTTGEAY